MTTESNNDNFIDLQLGEEIRKEQIVTFFRKDKRTDNLILSLNHTYRQKTVISPVYGHDWIKTTDTFVKELKGKGVIDSHILLLEDVLNTNYESVLGLSEISQAKTDTNNGQERKQISKIRKYSGNGTLPLHESIVFKDGQTSFLLLDEDKKPKYKTKIEIHDKVLHASDSLDSQNPFPYIFESPEELERYLEKAKNETFDSLYLKIKLLFRRFVNAEDHYISILSADTIYSYFQDKFATLHYNIFIGDNGSGKNSALLVYRYLGYRVFYVVGASAPNYFTFLGDIEECQGTIAEDEADDIGDNTEKKKILKTGYTSGGNVPKVDLTYGRKQESYLTYCMKWFAMEELPDYKKIKGILDRSFIYRFIVGDVEYNIKDVIKYAGESKFKPLHDELIDLRKLLFAFRMVHYDDTISDVSLNVKHRSAELTKPLLRLLSSQSDAPIALEEVRVALSKFISERNDLKKNSIESKLRDAINNLIKKRQDNPNSDDFKGLEPYTFYNEHIWSEVKSIMNGQDIPFKPQSFYTVEYGKISHKYVTSLYESKFKAELIKTGSGSETKRGLRFSKEVLDRLVIHYESPDEIKIRGQAGKLQQSEIHETVRDATHPTDATHYRNGEGPNYDDKSVNSHDNKNNNRNGKGNDLSDSTDCSRPYPIELSKTSITIPTRIDTVDEMNKHDNHNDKEVVIVSSNDNNKLGMTANEKEAPPFSKSVASVATVANRHNNTIEVKPISITNRKSILKLPEIPCAWCNYKDPIEFDLSLHLVANHKEELLKLPIGKGSMDYRADYVVDMAKRKMAEEASDEYEDDDIYDHSDAGDQ
jgi:hypothetical protein